MKTEQISIRLTAEQLQAIDQIAMKTVGDRSDHIRKALDQYIGRHSQAYGVSRTNFDDDGDPYPAVPSL